VKEEDKGGRKNGDEQKKREKQNKNLQNNLHNQSLAMSR
jgi:hypothetical protein